MNSLRGFVQPSPEKSLKNEEGPLEREVVFEETEENCIEENMDEANIGKRYKKKKKSKKK